MVAAHPFWLEPLGCGELVRGRHRLFNNLFDEVAVLYLSSNTTRCPLPGATIHLSGALTPQHVLDVKSFLAREKFTHLYFSYDLGGLAHQLEGFKILELHDVMHLREQSFRNFGYQAPISVSAAEELTSIRRYDSVLVLNIAEQRYLAGKGVEQALYLPPSTVFSPTPIHANARPVGLLGSMAKPNHHGLKQCLGLLVEHQGVVAGPLSRAEELKGLSAGSIRNMGVLSDVSDFYCNVKVVLAPIKFGAGLKIKVFEALAHGRPLIATKHAVAGFPDGIDGLVVVNDDTSQWDKSLIEKASSLAGEDFQGYCRANFSAEVLINRLTRVFSETEP
jgi:glycosyltransferase involved in cell wall biosynthesis